MTSVSLSGELPSVAEHSAEPIQDHYLRQPEQATHAGEPKQARSRGEPEQAYSPREPEPEQAQRGDRSPPPGEPMQQRELSLRERYARQTGAAEGLVERAALMKTATTMQLPGAGR